MTMGGADRPGKVVMVKEVLDVVGVDDLGGNFDSGERDFEGSDEIGVKGDEGEMVVT